VVKGAIISLDFPSTFRQEKGERGKGALSLEFFTFIFVKDSPHCPDLC